MLHFNNSRLVLSRHIIFLQYGELSLLYPLGYKYKLNLIKLLMRKLRTSITNLFMKDKLSFLSQYFSWGNRILVKYLSKFFLAVSSFTKLFEKQFSLLFWAPL